jgi:C-terminal processing protease CtpA/Prc
MRTKWLLVLAVALAVALGLSVAGEHEKCKMSTQDCLNEMATKLRTSGFVGVELDMDKDTAGYTILRVIPGTPAESAGLQANDVLVALNGVKISRDNGEALARARKEWKPGQTVTYTVQRDGAERQVTLTLAPMPADVMAKYIGEHMLEHASTEVAQKK